MSRNLYTTPFMLRIDGHRKDYVTPDMHDVILSLYRIPTLIT